MIRKLVYEDFPAASALLWKSFYFAEKHTATEEGMAHFRDATDPVALSMSDFEGQIQYYGYFEADRLQAVGAMKGSNHILLLYVRHDALGQGYGSKMLAFLEDKAEGDCVTVNASDFALSFYKKRGYRTAGPRNTRGGLTTTPMKKIKKILENALDKPDGIGYDIRGVSRD